MLLSVAGSFSWSHQTPQNILLVLSTTFSQQSQIMTLHLTSIIILSVVMQAILAIPVPLSKRASDSLSAADSDAVLNKRAYDVNHDHTMY